jgi:hypothetical protein
VQHLVEQCLHADLADANSKGTGGASIGRSGFVRFVLTRALLAKRESKADDTVKFNR